MFETTFVTTTFSQGSLNLVDAPIIVDADDFEGVHIAAATLSEDFAKVTGGSPNDLISSISYETDSAVIIGSISKSRIIQSLIEEGKLDVSSLSDKWECFTTQLVVNPIPGCSRALVIVGSDKRGTIFGLYTLSQQIGISPFHYWSDVPPKRSAELWALDITTREGPPSVKYRGIFINDEAPSLTGWVNEKIGPKFNAEFYKHVFELLLRLKANFLWPAMWFGYPHPGQSFFMDDVLNQETADRYGIVISTSHHEPMQRAANEWFSEPYNEPDGSWSWYQNKEKITQFFKEGAERAQPYESYITLGMRGQGDRKIEAVDATKALQEVIDTQRCIIENAYGNKSGECQLIALYKEVLTQYEKGLQIPDDVTLLLSDDNQGTIRRLPVGEEKNRSGGAGLYYHFEFVGHPRSYKWLNSNFLPKVWHQLDEAYENGVDRIWIFNVGDIKPMEIPMSFAMMKAWKIDTLKPSQLPRFFEEFINTHFELPKAEAWECAELLLGYDQMMSLGKHEFIEAETFSVINYDEADNVLRKWTNLLDRATKLYDTVNAESKPAFYQLIFHPIKATQIYMALRVTLAKNKHYAEQRRTSANDYAQQVLRLFDADYDLSCEYHEMLGGKWNHIMSQPHYGCRWEHDIAPFRDMVPGICYVQTRQKASPIMGWIGIAVEGHKGVQAGLVCEENDRTHPSRRARVPGVTVPPLEPFGPTTRWFELYSHSTQPVNWTVSSVFDWIHVSTSSGHLGLQDTSRIYVSVDWEKVPAFFDATALLEVRSDMGDFDYVHVPVKNREVPVGFAGFIESDRQISINAPSFSRINTGAISYATLPYLSRTGAGAVGLKKPIGDVDKIPSLHYPFFTFTPMSEAVLTLIFTMTMNVDPTDPLKYDVCVDDYDPSTYRLVPDAPNPGEAPPGDLPAGWFNECPTGVWTRKHKISLAKSGAHLLQIRLRNSNCLLEKIVIDLGGVRESYLGPPESLVLGNFAETRPS
ncbi:hypothetical protein N7493_000946 [Penicillium malachiteum]|uniref:Gylcosyl hydrolase 115 C-terminal domain-containing protein n=1 Tax=Penicillium malachiteum TaxID=1324776 RepID=A0AAD6HYG6_9EURO|nr:hypothetical protein N7493_000946 [Penicillium malachiteum]